MARSSAKTLINQSEFDFDSAENQLPRQEQFPLNIKGLDRSVSTVILQDIQSSTGSVTGFNSLSQIIDVLGANWVKGRVFASVWHLTPFLHFNPLAQEGMQYWQPCWQKEAACYLESPRYHAQKTFTPV
ncbi:hypothetical protein [Flaviaesturariibacter amylovorans]|uniref:hypothetical protein n=1 Tax=Flaviaesturariibacter amylovorans TaxID=1084520 RepID=UPI0031F1913E